MGILSNVERVGNFSSSEIVALTEVNAKGEFNKPAYTYIEECNIERRLGASIETEQTVRAFSWGKIIEKYVHEEILGLEYSLSSQETFVHPEIDYWVGSPDGEKEIDDTLTDIKGPLTKKSFCKLVAPLYEGLQGMDAFNAIRNGLDKPKISKHNDGDKFYWQLVSNTCIKNRKYAELIVFMPYLRELEKIREFAAAIDDPLEQRQYYWIHVASDDELPWIPEGGYYKNLNIIRFEVPKADKIFLKQQVKKGGDLLIPRLLTLPDQTDK